MPRSRSAILGVVTLGLALFVSSRSIDDGRSALKQQRPAEAPGEGYTTSDTCRACHPDQYASWHDSYHRTMTQVATPETVIGDFDDVELSVRGERYRLYRNADEFWVEMDGGRGAPQDNRRILLTTGSHHRQWVWYSAGPQRQLGTIPFIYLKDRQRWVPRYAAFMLPPDPDWEPSRHEGLWGRGCIACHTTDSERRGPANDEPRVAEFGIACEACHGPAEDHVRSQRNPIRRYRLYATDVADATIVNPRRLPHARGSEVCGQCHSVTAAQGAFRPGDDLSAVRPGDERRSPLPEVSHWPDGVIHTGGREYDALIATPCFERGEMSCMSCHTMHQAADDSRGAKQWAEHQVGAGMRGDSACLQCHAGAERCYDCEEHTHHASDSRGVGCYDCHMPYTSYALLKAIRNHRVVPDTIAQTLASGRPNACNLCHLDRSLGWTADRLAEWYGTPRPALSADQANVAAAALWATTGHAGQRALAAWHMGWEPARRVSGEVWLTPYLTLLMNDPYPAVRLMAYRSLIRLEAFEDLRYDYVGPEAARLAALERAVEIWRRQLSDRTKTGDALLIKANGSLLDETFIRLVGERDQKPVVWIE